MAVKSESAAGVVGTAVVRITGGGGKPSMAGATCALGSKHSDGCLSGDSGTSSNISSEPQGLLARGVVATTLVLVFGSAATTGVEKRCSAVDPAAKGVAAG